MTYIWDVSNTKSYNNRTGHYKFNKEYSFIKKYINEDISSVFDVCGGSGRFAIPLSQIVKNVSVLDINSEAIQILNSKSNKIKTYCCDLREFETKDNYDLIIIIEAIGYFENKDWLLNKAHSLLNDNGLLIFQITNPHSWRYSLRTFKNLFSKRTNYYEPGINDIKAFLYRQNFEIVEIEGMNWIPLSLKSNHILVGFFEFLEYKLQLNKWIQQSPWLMICAKKI